MLSCQYGAKSLQNVSATFLNQCHEGDSEEKRWSDLVVA